MDTNEGLDETKKYRSRLVVMETKRRSTFDAQDKGAAFSATPPLEAIRMLASMAMTSGTMTMEQDPEDDTVLIFLDISRAHPHIDMKRELHIEIPAERPEHAAGQGREAETTPVWSS